MPKTKIIHGSRKVFADIGFADAGERQAKMRLALELNKSLQPAPGQRRQTARLFSAETSALTNYRLDGFSVERVMDFLASLDRDVEIVIRPRSVGAGAGQISVIATRQSG